MLSPFGRMISLVYFGSHATLWSLAATEPPKSVRGFEAWAFKWGALSYKWAFGNSIMYFLSSFLNALSLSSTRGSSHAVLGSQILHPFFGKAITSLNDLRFPLEVPHFLASLMWDNNRNSGQHCSSRQSARWWVPPDSKTLYSGSNNFSCPPPPPVR